MRQPAIAPAALVALAALLVSHGFAGEAAKGAPAAARLVVSQQLVQGAPDYRYGSRARLRVRDSRGKTVVLHRGRHALIRRLPAGDYRLTSWQRPCADSGCRSLRAPTDLCTLGVGIGEGQRVVAVVILRPGRGCSLETADPPASLPG